MEILGLECARATWILSAGRGAGRELHPWDLTASGQNGLMDVDVVYKALRYESAGVAV